MRWRFRWSARRPNARQDFEAFGAVGTLDDLDHPRADFGEGRRPSTGSGDPFRGYDTLAVDHASAGNGFSPFTGADR